MARLGLVTNDLLFRTAVESIAGAMGHSVALVASTDDAEAFALMVVDWIAVSDGGATAFYTLSTVVYAPAVLVPAARAATSAHVEPRTSLAATLPRLISEHVP